MDSALSISVSAGETVPEVSVCSVLGRRPSRMEVETSGAFSFCFAFSAR